MSAFQFTVHTDKAPGGWHAAYCEVYDRLFRPLKDTELPILEIGVDGGGFTLALRDYFANAAVISCLDISGCPKSIIDDPRIQFFQQDAYAEEVFSKEIKARFAVIIDDGPHILGSQQFFVANYPHLLSENGVAVVEDVQDIAHFNELAKCLPAGFFGYGIDLRMHDDGRYDNLLFVIHRA